MRQIYQSWAYIADKYAETILLWARYATVVLIIYTFLFFKLRILYTRNFLLFWFIRRRTTLFLSSSHYNSTFIFTNTKLYGTDQ